MKRPVVRLLLIVPLTGLLVAGLLTAAWLAVGSPRPARAAKWFAVHKVSGAASFAEAPTAPFFVLVIGSDTRNEALLGLADALHVIGVNPATGDATILDIPRDTQGSRGDKITTYHASGGLPAMVDEFNRMMGINISYAISTTFGGFISMVDEIGGVEIEITEPMFDVDAATAFNPGRYKMPGESLLAYARDRKSYPAAGDRQRTVNQGKAIIAALTTLRAQNPGAAGTARFISILARHVRTHNIGLGEMYRLGRLGLSIDPARVRNVLVPTGPGGGSDLAVAPEARGLFADFADDAILQAH
jgi:LCP family protein required for cell wall assembly